MKSLITLVSFASTAAFAAGGAHGDAHGGIPFDVTLQAINFVLFAVILFFVLKKPVRNFFSGRGIAFKDAAEKARKVKDAAQSKVTDLENRLRMLNEGQAQSISEAREQAEKLKNELIADAEKTAKRIIEEAKATAVAELESAKSRLRAEVAQQIIRQAQSEVQSTYKVDDQNNLEKSFIAKIGGVNQ